MNNRFYEKLIYTLKYNIITTINTMTIDALPIDMRRYIYKFVYPEVMISHWTEKYGLDNIIKQLINEYPLFYADIMYESINKYFPEKVDILFNYFTYVCDKVDGRKISWYEPIYDYPDDNYIKSIINTVVSILSSANFDKSVYNIVASYIILINNAEEDDYDC